MKRILKFAAVSLALMTVLGGSVLAATPYQSYTYTYGGDPILSPDAYVPGREYSGAQLDPAGLKEPSDLFVSGEGDVYIADTGNNRILILNPDMSLKTEIYELQDPDKSYKKYTFRAPGGVFVNKNGDIYVADSGNGRIIVMDRNFAFKQVLEAPESDIFPEGFVYTPNSLVVDNSGRIYVVVNSCNMGVLALKPDGSFESFMGAQKVSPSVWELFWRIFMTEEQRERTKKFVPSEYNNIAIDSEGFIFITSSAIDAWSQYSATISRSNSSQYAPLKMLNSSGVDVLRRTGFFPPSGDVRVEFGSDSTYGPSSITDVAVGPYGTYSIVDSRRNKIFTYDTDGNLLFAFSGKGMQTGLFQSVTSIAYQGDKILVLDKVRNSITVFDATPYGKQLYSAIDLHDQRRFREEAEVWSEILADNANLDIAYTGMGSAMMQQQEYRLAMEYFKQGRNVSEYSRAYEQARKQEAKKFFLLIPLLAVVLIFAVVKAAGWMKRYNKAHIACVEKRPVRQQLIYGAHYIFHPFDGAWDLTRENRGGYAGAMIFLGLSVLSFILKDLLAGFIVTGGNKDVDIFGSALNVLLPFIIFCIANWCLTSLMDGEGSMKSIIVTSAYSLIPLVLLVVPTTLIGNLLLVDEMAVFQMLSSITYLWMGALLFAGTLTIHGYSLPKNILTILLTLVGMAFIIFLCLLFVTLGGQMLSFFGNLYKEYSFRA